MKLLFSDRRNNCWWRLCLLALIVASLAPADVTCETGAGLSEPAYSIDQDFAVPDAPALKILDEDATRLMRPSTSRLLAANLSGFLNSRGTLPRAVAVEFSPGMLFMGKSLTLQQYQDNEWKRFLYRARVSIGTKRNSDVASATDLALGLRLSLADCADLRIDKEYLNGLFDFWQVVHDSIVSMRNSLRGNPALFANLPADSQEAINNLIAKRESELVGEYTEIFRKYQETARNDNWRATSVELGFAAALSSSDSLIKNMKPSRYGMWLTGAFPFTRSGQILVGANANLVQDSLRHVEDGDAAVTVRAYGGGADLRAFLEADAKWNEARKPEYVGLLGGELRISKGIWGEFRLGASKVPREPSRLETGFNLRFGTPN